MVSVPALDALTQARAMEEVEDVARSLIAISTGAPEASIALRVDVDPPGAGWGQTSRPSATPDHTASTREAP
jgi:hypothetical protein